MQHCCGRNTFSLDHVFSARAGRRRRCVVVTIPLGRLRELVPYLEKEESGRGIGYLVPKTAPQTCTGSSRCRVLRRSMMARTFRFQVTRLGLGVMYFGEGCKSGIFHPAR